MLHRQPLFFALAGLVLGTLSPLEEATFLTWAMIAAASSLALLAVVLPSRTPLAALIVACAAAGACLSLSARAAYRTHELPTDLARVDGSVLIEGRVASDPTIKDGEMRLDLVSRAIETRGVRRPFSGRVRIFVRLPDQPEPTAPPIRRAVKGDVLRAWIDLRTPQPVRTPGGFDQESWAMREGIHAFGTCKSERLIQFIETAAHPRTLLDLARDRLRQTWRHVPEPLDRAVTASMILGDEGALDDATREDFRSAGLLHLLVVSGSQIAALILGLRRIMPKRLRLSWSGCVLECVILTSYCALAGADNSIVRATVMAVAFAVAVRIDLHRGGANFLAAAALCLLAFRPLDALDPGAQMSFAATLALVLFASPLARRMEASRVPGFLADVVAATLVATIAVVPLTLIHFHRFSVVALPANLVAAPLAVILLYGSLATATLDSFFTPAAAFAGIVCGYTAEGLRTLAHLAASLDPDWRGPSPPAALIFGSIGLIASFGWRRHVLPIAGLLAALSMSGLPRGDGRLHLWFLDVGQGDSLLIETPQGEAAIVDAGPAFESFDAGERIVGEALWELGHRRLDFLAVTHRHADHEGGAPFLARHFSPRRVYVNGPSRALKDFVVTPSQRGDSWSIDGVSVSVLGPDPAWAAPQSDENARSLVLEIRYGLSRFLILGDANRRVESRLDLSGPYDVVKVGHHGAATSSSDSLVRSVRPALSLISVGDRNRFSHPSAVVVERWRRAGALVWRTDLDRTLHVVSDGRKTTID